MTGTLNVLAERDGAGWKLASPAPGRFRPSITQGAQLVAGRTIGVLEILGRAHLLIIPDGVAGYANAVGDVRVVQHGEALCAVLPGGITEATQATQTQAAAQGRVFRAPTSGRFYARSSPDKPPFVSAGDELAPGTTVCLLEVMKTFHRVTYSGERAKIRDVLVREGDDINAGDALLALED